MATMPTFNPPNSLRFPNAEVPPFFEATSPPVPNGVQATAARPYNQPIPMRPGPGGLQGFDGTPFAQATYAAVPNGVQATNAPPSFPMRIPMRLGPNGFTAGRPYAGSTTNPTKIEPNAGGGGGEMNRRRRR